MPAERPLFYYITDRTQLAPGRLAATVRGAIARGVHLVQVREKDLADGLLCEVVEEIVAAAAGTKCRVLVNGRVDVALASGAHGVHLPENGLPVSAVREIVPHGFLVGCSAHSLRAAKRAEEDGADYLLVSPVYETPSKAAYGPPLGIDAFSGICRRIGIPVLGLGGVNLERVPEVLAAGAAGVAGIRIFQERARGSRAARTSSFSCPRVPAP